MPRPASAVKPRARRRGAPTPCRPSLDLVQGGLEASLDLADPEVITYHRRRTRAAGASGLAAVTTVEERGGRRAPAGVERPQAIAREPGVKVVGLAPNAQRR